MTNLPSLRTPPKNTLFKSGDVFVLFGELFGRGYVTGLIDQAKAAGMTIIGVTVGRRDDNNQLRELTAGELSEAEERLGGKIINVPLMAGFDQDAPDGYPTPTEMLNKMTLDNWEDYQLDWQHVEKCRTVGVERITTALEQAMSELSAMIPRNRNVFFAHTMAGGIPRSKVFMAIANRIYKGRGARYMPSESLIKSDLGKFILQNFDEVTANSFQHLLTASAPLRERIEAAGGEVRYTAYGYHGTCILMDDDYHWQTYTSYTQGFAKMQLEEIARRAWMAGVKATVFNCPEIRTNSSDVFAGIELSLLPLLKAVRKEGSKSKADALWGRCQRLLKDGVSVDDILAEVERYQKAPEMKPFYSFDDWPMNNSAGQVEQTVGTSQDIVAMHKDRKHLISDLLSEHVVRATGELIFAEASNPSGPVLWLNHDVVARQITGK